MKREKIIYLTAFLFGVIGTNILVSKSWIDIAYLHRHELLQLSYSEMRCESYLIELLLHRLKIVTLLWLLGRVFPLKLIRYVFGGILCMVLGSILTGTILANGVWGVLLFGGMLFPQWIFYVGAYIWWGKFYDFNRVGNDRRKKLLPSLILILFVVSGCMTEAYVNPSVFYQVIK